jgi:hypothetical protein
MQERNLVLGSIGLKRHVVLGEMYFDSTALSIE